MSSNNLDPIMDAVLALTTPPHVQRTQESQNVAVCLVWWWGTLWIVSAFIIIAALIIRLMIS